MVDDTTPGDADRLDPEDMDSVADRLEAALDRIVRHLEAAGPAVRTAELAERLDGLIGRLRDVLGHPRE